MARSASYARRSGLAFVTVVMLLAGCSSAGEPAASSSSPARSPLTPVPVTSGPVTSSAPATQVPTYLERVRWAPSRGGRSLRVFPTHTGRTTQQDGAAEVAWQQVVRLAPTATTPTMKAQFDCHWTFARVAQPDKRSWNLETWRPVVSPQAMFDTRCNPGGPEE